MRAERFEVGVRKPHGKGFGPGEVPGGPRPLPAVFVASWGRTPSASRAARRRRGIRHCRHSWQPL